MTRDEHNQYWGVNRQSDEQVCCSLFGYGELTQYDKDCAWCWLGYKHTWAQHDRDVLHARQQRA